MQLLDAWFRPGCSKTPKHIFFFFCYFTFHRSFIWFILVHLLLVHYFHFKCSRYCICIISFVVLVWKYSCHACTLSHSILALTIPQGSLGINKSFLRKCPGIGKFYVANAPLEAGHSEISFSQLLYKQKLPFLVKRYSNARGAKEKFTVKRPEGREYFWANILGPSGRWSG